MLANRGRPPLRASFIALMVTALGISGANGRGLLVRHPGQQQPDGVGHGQAHGGQYGGRFFLHGPVDAGLDELIRSHLVSAPLS